MRQAGRYLPEYREIRKKEPNFLDLCFTPNLAAEISLQPIKRFDFDFIILFSDILVIPYALNQKVTFKKNHGPLLDPVSSINDLSYKNMNQNINRISSVFETINILNQKKAEKNLIGFCGGAFTVLNYMIEGGTSKTHEKIIGFIKREKRKALDFIQIILDLTIEYLKKQIDHGVDYIQVFESWAGLLSNEEYETFVIDPNKIISNKIREYSPKTKIIHFPRGSCKNYINFLNEVECDVISLDNDYPEEVLTIAKKKKIIIQGNLNPVDLIKGGPMLQKRTLEILEKFKDVDHIFNLSHGILPETPIENVEKIVKLVKNYEYT
jgi:uroporphyrinogen decarboxylase